MKGDDNVKERKLSKETKNKKAKSRKESTEAKDTKINNDNDLELIEDQGNAKTTPKHENKKKKSFTKEEEQTEQENQTCSIFISGIPYESTLDDLKSIFTDCGEIASIKMPSYQDSGKNRGYAHIVFSEASSASKALLKDKVSKLGSRYLTVQLSKGENKVERKADLMDIPDDCRTVIIKNLDYNITETELAQKFKPCGSIHSVRMVYHSRLNHFKGFAFIDFDKPESVKIALHLNGKELNNRKMVVDFEENRPKQGFKFRSSEPSKFNKEYNDIKHKSLNKKRNNN